MRLGLVQFAPEIGKVARNAAKMKAAIACAFSQGASLVVFPELSLVGYPPMDLLKDHDLRQNCTSVMADLALVCDGPVLVGAPAWEEDGIYNAVYLLHKKEVKVAGKKVLLPNYDVFDESRYFKAGNGCSFFNVDGFGIGLTVCEDIWSRHADFKYGMDPLDALLKSPDGAAIKLIINMAASPYSIQGKSKRKLVLQDVANRHRRPLAYINQVGARADLIFDGGTSYWDAHGNEMATCPPFEESVLLVETGQEERFEAIPYGDKVRQEFPLDGKFQDLPSDLLLQDSRHRVLGLKWNPYEVTQALCLGIRDYLRMTGGERVVVGLSGGVDSAVVTCLAVMALGADRVTALLMPSGYSSERSVTDSLALCALHGVSSQILPIEASFVAVKNTLAGAWEEPIASLTEENIQPRLRALLLMAYSNQYGDMWLNSSNKSEAAVGYSTLYGDMGGGLSVIGDLYKTQVYALAAAWNLHRLWIPHGILEAAPSAELKPNQLDSDSLPPYPVLDALLMDCIEGGMDQGALEAAGHQPALVQKVLGMLRKSEYKRYQMPPVLRVSSRSFGRGWRRSLV